MIDAFVKVSDLARRAGVDEDVISAAHGQFFDGNIEAKNSFRVAALLARISTGCRIQDEGARAVVDCVFCQIIAGTSPAVIVESWPDALAIVPLGPVTEGHTLVMPRAHVRDFAEDPVVTAATMARAAQLAQAYDITPANLITSAGREATQSVFHLHVHVVPRREDDGLALPWYSGRRRRGAVPVG